MPHSDRPTRYKVAHTARMIKLHLADFCHALFQTLACSLHTRLGRTQAQTHNGGKVSLRHALQVAQRNGLAVFGA